MRCDDHYYRGSSIIAVGWKPTLRPCLSPLMTREIWILDRNGGSRHLWRYLISLQQIIQEILATRNDPFVVYFTRFWGGSTQIYTSNRRPYPCNVLVLSVKRIYSDNVPAYRKTFQFQRIFEQLFSVFVCRTDVRVIWRSKQVASRIFAHH